MKLTYSPYHASTGVTLCQIIMRLLGEGQWGGFGGTGWLDKERGEAGRGIGKAASRGWVEVYVDARRRQGMCAHDKQTAILKRKKKTTLCPRRDMQRGIMMNEQ